MLLMKLKKKNDENYWEIDKNNLKAMAIIIKSLYESNL